MLSDGPAPSRLRHICGPLAVAALVALGAAFPEGTLPLRGRLLITAATCCAVGIAAWRASGLLLPDVDRLSRLVASFTLAVALCVVPATWLGHGGLLSPRLLLTVLAAITAAFAFLPPVPLAEPGDSRAAADVTPRARAERLAVAAAAGALGASLVTVVWLSRGSVPGQVQYDDSSYHLPAVATFRAFEDLGTLKFPFGDPSTAFYPIGGELFSFALLAPLSPDDFLARWAELPFALFLLVAIASIARRSGLSEPQALLAAVLFAATPRVFQDALMLSAGTDVATAFLVLATVLSALLLREQATPGRAVAAGVALGLLVGTKYTGLLFAVPLAGLLLVAVTAAALERQERRFRALASAVALLGVVAIVAIATGGTSYLRNAVATGNPVFPAVVRLAGHDLLSGLRSADPATWRVRPENAVDPIGFLLRSGPRLGLHAPFVLLPAAVLSPVLALLLPASPRRRLTTAFLFALPAVFYVQFLLQMLDHRDVRYVLAAPALAAIAAVWLAARLAGWRGALPRSALATAAVGSALATWRAEGLSGGAYAAVLVVGAAVGAVASRVPVRPFPAPAAAAAFALLLVAAAPAVEQLAAARYASSPIARELDARTAAAGARVAYTGGNQPYPYFGSRLQNAVTFVPTYRDETASRFGWRGSLRFPREELSFTAWRDNLRSEGVRFLVIEGMGDTSAERRWAALDPAELTLVAESGSKELWELRPAAYREGPPLEVRAAGPRSALLVDRRMRTQSDPPAFVVPASGAAFVLPPCDRPVAAIELALLPGDPPPAGGTVRLNGAHARVSGTAGPPGTIRLDVPPGSWSAGTNVIDLVPAGAVRLSALRLVPPAGPSHVDRVRWAPDIPASLDEPAEGSTVSSSLLVRGWCQDWGGRRVEVAEVRLDGVALPLAGLVRFARLDVESALPGIGPADTAGFELRADTSALAPGEHLLLVTFRALDGRVHFSSPRSFRVGGAGG